MIDVNRAGEIVERLNAIEAAGDEPGNNSTQVWEYMTSLPEYDAARIDEVDPSGVSDRIPLTDGSMIVWDEPRKTWAHRF